MHEEKLTQVTCTVRFLLAGGRAGEPPSLPAAPNEAFGQLLDTSQAEDTAKQTNQHPSQVDIASSSAQEKITRFFSSPSYVSGFSEFNGFSLSARCGERSFQDNNRF